MQKSVSRIVRGFPLVLLTFGLMLLLPALGHVSGHSGDVLSAYGTATVDGVVSPGEYGSCIGPVTQNGYTFKICETNDSHNDTYAIAINDLTFYPQDDLAVIYFDNAHDGSITGCGSGVEDMLVINGTAGILPMYVDANYCANSGWMTDFLFGGKSDAAVAVKFTPGVGYVYEVSHPLDSGDSKDYALTTSSTVGWCFIYFAGPIGSYDFPQVQYPVGVRDLQ